MSNMHRSRMQKQIGVSSIFSFRASTKSVTTLELPVPVGANLLSSRFTERGSVMDADFVLRPVAAALAPAPVVAAAAVVAAPVVAAVDAAPVVLPVVAPPVVVVVVEAG